MTREVRGPQRREIEGTPGDYRPSSAEVYRSMAWSGAKRLAPWVAVIAVGEWWNPYMGAALGIAILGVRVVGTELARQTPVPTSSAVVPRGDRSPGRRGTQSPGRRSR